MSSSRPLRTGVVLLTVWSGLNAVVAAAVTVFIFAGATPPVVGMVVPESAFAQLDPTLLAVINAQAALANPCIVALCALVLWILWTRVRAGDRGAQLLLVAVLIPLQACGFVSDAYLGHKNLAANLISTALLVTGLLLCAVRRKPA
jgi:hypothetical protein